MKTNKTGVQIILLLSALFLLLNAELRAQKYLVEANYLQGFHYNSQWAFFKGGTELSASMLFHREPISFRAGFDFRTVQWGNQISGTFSLSKVLSKATEAVFEIQNGLALFRSNSLYAIGFTLKGNYILIKKPKVQAGITAGLRFSSCPGYARYSEIYNIWELPAGIYFNF